MVEVSRVLLALTFVFSGFVKVVDPWGTAIKIEEYLAVFGMEWLSGCSFFLAIWLTGAEMMLGLMVLFRVRLRITSILIFAAMTFFTFLTLYSAIWSPVEDCGCFGDAIRMTNWETFIKNVILWPMAFIVMWDSRRKPMMPTWSDLWHILAFGAISFGIGFYSFRHLPLIDFLPYKKGTDIAAVMNAPFDDAPQVQSVVIVRNLETGKRHEFDIEDPTWYDESRWEFVDIRNTAVNARIQPTVRDFAVIDAEGMLVTDEILEYSGTTLMIFATDPADITPRCARRLERVVRQAVASGHRVMHLTAASLSTHPELVLGSQRVPSFNMDAKTMITMLRARTGVVVLRGGVIEDKKNCRSMSNYKLYE